MARDFKSEIKLFLIVAVIAAVVSVAGVFLLRELSPAPVSSPQPQIIGTSIWQTYRNDEFGFEVKYPIGFTFVSTGLSNEQERLERGETISGTVAPSFDTIHFYDQKNEPVVSITIFHPLEEDLSKESYTEGYLYLYGPCDLRWGFESSSIKEMKLLSHSVLIVQGNNTLPELGPALMCAYLKNKAGNVIVMDSENLSLLDQILSTFRFVE